MCVPVDFWAALPRTLTVPLPQHEVLAAVAAGKHVVLCKPFLPDLAFLRSCLYPGGHTNTERGYLPTLATKLRQHLAEDQVEGVELIVSEKDRHPLDIV
jgi:hypothetical protein